MTTAVDALEREGLLTRRPAPTDRRATLVVLIPSWAASHRGVAGLHRQLSDDIMAPLGPHARRQLMTVLERDLTEGLAKQPAE